MRRTCLSALVASAAFAGGCAHGAAGPTRGRAPPAAAAGVVAGPSAAALAPEVPRAGEGVVRFDCHPVDAEVVVDGVTYGRVSDFEKPPYLTLRPGSHRITLRHRGYASYHTEVYLSGSVIETVSVSLTPRKVVAGASRETLP